MIHTTIKLFAKIPVATLILYLLFSTILIQYYPQIRYRTDINDLLGFGVSLYVLYFYPIDLALTLNKPRWQTLAPKLILVFIISQLLMVFIANYFSTTIIKIGLKSAADGDIHGFPDNKIIMLKLTLFFSFAIGIILYIIQTLIQWRLLKITILLYHAFITMLVALIFYAITLFLFSNRIAVSFTDYLIYLLAGMTAIIIHKNGCLWLFKKTKHKHYTD